MFYSTTFILELTVILELAYIPVKGALLVNIIKVNSAVVVPFCGRTELVK